MQYDIFGTIYILLVKKSRLCPGSGPAGVGRLAQPPSWPRVFFVDRPAFLEFCLPAWPCGSTAAK